VRVEQWSFFGIYLDTQDHRIEFKEAFTPEFAVFLDIDRKSRERLASLNGIADAVKLLEREGFEFNFPLKKNSSPDRLCYWRDPVRKYLNSEPSDICRMFERRIGVLFGSDFFQKVARAGKAGIT
jgi:hypothetical protein